MASIVLRNTGEIDSNFHAAEQKARRLFVLLHALNSSPEGLQKVAALVRSKCADGDIFVPHMPIGGLSFANPETVSSDVLSAINKYVREKEERDKEGYDSIVLIGHSMGAVLARKLWALAHGVPCSAEMYTTSWKAKYNWANKIDRIVLMAAMNRGWMISSALHPLTRLMWTFGSGVGHIFRHVFRLEPVAFALRRGAPFLTMTRLQCLALKGKDGVQQPTVVQLLGTADDFVAPTDNIDVATDNSFYYIEVPEATHTNIIQLNAPGIEEALETAFMGDVSSIKEKALKPDDIKDIYDDSVDDYDIAGRLKHDKESDEIKNVIFVIHGIRDRGFWTRRIAGAVKSLARRNGHTYRAVTSTYGYFPMGPFLLPWTRFNKLEWLLDQYVTVKSIYPKAAFHYIGHSNGTWLLAQAFEKCKAVKFERVVFCGSVVNSSFDWDKIKSNNQVEMVLNYAATDDWVVSVFPQGLGRLGVKDLGGAGHFGFPKKDFVHPYHYVDGGHGGALAQRRWHEMAEFIVGRAKPTSPDAKHKRWNAGLAYAAPAICLILIGVLLFLVGWPLYKAGAAWFYALLFAVVLYSLHKFLTKA